MARLLLDTHILLWSQFEREKLPDKATGLIRSRRHVIYYSIVSLWEVELKHIARPDKLDADMTIVMKYCRRAGYRLLPLKVSHMAFLKTLSIKEDAPRHKDPFDRMLLSQAKSEGMRFITHDGKIKYYDEPCVYSV